MNKIMKFLLLIFILCIPIDNYTSVWLNFGGGINFTTIFTVLLIVAWVMNRGNNSPLFIKNSLNLPILLLLLFTFISFFTGSMKLEIPFFGDEFRIYKSFITVFILFFIVANNLKDKKDIKSLLNVMIFMVIVTSLLSIKAYREADIWHYDEGTRVQLFGLQPNMLGSFFAQFAPIFASFAFLTKKLKSKFFYIALFSLILSGIMFTYSRGAYLSILGALTAMVILGGRKPLKGVIILLVFGIAIQAILFGQGKIIPVSVRERFEMIKGEDIRDNDHSITLRKQVWDDAVKYIFQSPIFGYGFGASDHILFMDTHNMYLYLALGCGIPTVLILIWLLIKALIVALRVYKTSNDDFYKAIALGLVGSVTALAIGNYFGTRLVLLAANGYCAILMGMVAYIYTEQVRQRAKVIKKARVNFNG